MDKVTWVKVVNVKSVVLAALVAVFVGALPGVLPAASAQSPFGDGIWVVGSQVAADRYVAVDVDGCSWKRLSGFGGSFEEIIEFDFVGAAGQVIVDIAVGDVGFESSGCGDWVPVSARSFVAFRNGNWFYDWSGNGTWDGCGTDRCEVFGTAGDIPVSSNVQTVFRAGMWFSDANASGAWDGCGSDSCVRFGAAGDQPVRAGMHTVFRNGRGFIDSQGNPPGDEVWDGCGVDTCYTFGAAGDTAVYFETPGVIGVFRAGMWFIDLNGNGVWDGCGTDNCVQFGAAGDQAMVTSDSQLAVKRGGKTYVDLNNNLQWDGCAIDRCITIGAPNGIGLFIPYS